MRSTLSALGLTLALLAGPALAAPETLPTSVAAESVPAPKRTPLGLYLTARDAARALEADPGIVFVDVRDPIEATFVGHPTLIDALVPFMIATHAYDPALQGYAMRPNPAFVAEVDRAMAAAGQDRQAPVIVMCRSGGRSAMAARALIAAGYTRVWNLIDGFEGDRGPDGRRSVNGWRNAGLPWSTELAPDAAWVPAD